MGIGFAPTRLRQVSPPPATSLDDFNHCSLATKTEELKAVSEGGVLGRGQQPPHRQIWGLGERCELPRWGLGWRARPPKGFHYFKHIIILLTVVGLFKKCMDYHAAIGGARPHAPWRTPLFSQGLNLLLKNRRHRSPLYS